MKKDYTNNDVTIIWEPKKCIHAGICKHGLPTVFKPKERPWIQLEHASSEEILNQVKQCPSGALSIKEKN